MDVKKGLKNTIGDYAHGLAKATLGSVPVVGNGLSELFTLLVTQPSEKRKENILIMIDERLKELKVKVDRFNIEQLSTNENFLSVTLQATQISLRTHQDDKRVALLNAITNSALSTSVDENLQQMFLSFIDTFNEWHLRILVLLKDPKQYLEAAGLNSNFSMGGLSDVVYLAYPELRSNDEFTKQIFNDLYNKGLSGTGASGLNTMMTGSGMVAARLSRMGVQFLEFISDPSELR
ncbi:hypothetical protein HPY28_05590 [Brevibacillus sp. HB1.2]|uniref:hypothetical protein n=1 Tax=Brevibacillus sp. HB1.2 TaxID=2738807 RepID=UPI0015754FB8|nr:hypothetical protein [Brevibacillus sp. HB1.2]NTU19793.1 hypothetical protein [Brevibacillus sp. HB1.2]